MIELIFYKVILFITPVCTVLALCRVLLADLDELNLTYQDNYKKVEKNNILEQNAYFNSIYTRQTNIRYIIIYK